MIENKLKMKKPKYYLNAVNKLYSKDENTMIVECF